MRYKNKMRDKNNDEIRQHLITEDKGRLGGGIAKSALRGKTNNKSTIGIGTSPEYAGKPTDYTGDRFVLEKIEEAMDENDFDGGTYDFIDIGFDDLMIIWDENKVRK